MATTTTRTNTYAGTCINCRRTVAARAGVLSSANGRWVVAHTDCGTATTATGTLAPGWSNASRGRGGYTRNATMCRYCGGIVTRGGCTDCGEGHEDY